ncbi:MAG: hypothetical protein KF861_11110 [Planctomycetaceae bacterium]|nr:hypothetical protein [Planctomycetaceae bacterium]
MSASAQRDLVITLVRNNSRKAIDLARRIKEPWYRAQALSWVARFTDGNAATIAAEAAKAARACEDDYQKSAVRAWEIAALAERSCLWEARASLSQALAVGKSVKPISSRSEALLLLLQAALRIGPEEAKPVDDALSAYCPVDEHWRAKRAVRDAARIMSGSLAPRPFFW